MDAISLISGFLGLLLAGFALRARRRERSERFWWLAAFGFAHALESGLHLVGLLYPELNLSAAPALLCRGIGYGTLFLFASTSLRRTPRELFTSEDLLPPFWLLLLAIACVWGWRQAGWVGLDTALRHGLALPAALLSAWSLRPQLQRGPLRNRIAPVLIASGWLTFALFAGLGVPSPALASLGFHWPPALLDLVPALTALSLLAVCSGLWFYDWRGAEIVGGERLALIWMQPTSLALAIGLGLLLAQWQQDFLANKFKERLETILFQFAANLPGPFESNEPASHQLEDFVHQRLRQSPPPAPGISLYTITKDSTGRLIFGPPGCPVGSACYPSLETLEITPLDQAAVERGLPFTSNPNFAPGRFLTSVTPIQDRASGDILFALGINVTEETWLAQRQAARRLPLLAAIALSLLCLAAFSYNLRRHLSRSFPSLPFESISVFAFGILITFAAAGIVGARVAATRLTEDLQTTTALAAAINGKLDQVSRDLATLARLLSSSSPPTAASFFQALAKTATTPVPSAWFLLDPRSTVVAVESPNPAGSTGKLRPGLTLPPAASSILGPSAILCPETDSSLTQPIPGQPGWEVGGSCQPEKLIQEGFNRLGPRKITTTVALVQVQNDQLSILAAQPNFKLDRSISSAPIFFGDQVWELRTAAPTLQRPLANEVSFTLVAGSVITGMTLLVVIFLKRRQLDLEADISARTTELRAREAESRELYERLQRIAAQVPGVVFQLKRAPDGTLTFPYLSDAARTAFGLPTLRIQAEPNLAIERIHPEDRNQLLNALNASARDMAPWREEFRIGSGPSAAAWFEGSAIPQRFPDGSIVWTGVIYDITERKRYETELLYRVDFQQLLTELATSFLKTGLDHLDETFNHLLERVGTFVGADRAYIFMLDRTRRTTSNTHEWCAPGISPEKDNLQNLPFEDIPEIIESQMAGRQFLLPDCTQLPPGPMRELLLKQQIKSLILLPFFHEGTCLGFAGFDAVRHYRTWHPQEISLLEVMASMVTQILLRRKDEQALRESEDQLRRNWEFTRTLLNAIPTPVFYMDRDGHFSGCNRSYLEFTGFSVESFAGKTVFDLFDLALAEEFHARDLELLRTGQRQSFEGTISDMLGRKREVVFNRDVFRNEKGEITGIVGSFIDISRVRKAEQEQREMERQLLHSQKLESLGVLAGGVAHDFNNILLAITGNLELAKLDLPPNSEALRAIEDAFLATRRAVDLTRQMLAYSGKGHFVVQDIDLNRLITDNLAIFKAAVAKNVTFEHELAPELPSIRGDLGQIQQIIMNLITNGSEAVGANPGSVRVSSYTQEFSASDLAACRGEVIPEPGNYVVLKVSDTGSGMDSATLNRIFEPFFSTKFTGRGLGMAAVLGILRGHNGGILIDSQPGRGTSIRVLFPASSTPSAATETPLSAPADDQTLHGRILLADDEADVRRVCAKLLERLGLEVHPVADGMEAVLAVEAQPFAFDLALLDLTMPNMDGLATLTYLSKHYPNLPVILTSGYSRDEVVGASVQSPNVGFIQKPFRLEILQTEISRFLKPASKQR